MESQSSASNSHAFTNSFSSSNKDKYHGMVPKSFIKKLQNDLFRAFLYMIEEAPQIPVIHIVVTVIRSLQYFGSVFFSSYFTFYKKDTPAFEFMNVISVFYHFCPGSIMVSVSGILCYIYGIILTAFFASFVVVSQIYKVKAVLPSYINVMITYFIFSI
jgi:hypothetical protein